MSLYFILFFFNIKSYINDFLYSSTRFLFTICWFFFILYIVLFFPSIFVFYFYFCSFLSFWYAFLSPKDHFLSCDSKIWYSINLSILLFFTLFKHLLTYTIHSILFIHNSRVILQFLFLFLKPPYFLSFSQFS